MIWGAFMGLHSQEVIFHETFNTPYLFTQDPATFGSNESSNGKWSYWGIWDPSPGNSSADFGVGEIPDAPAFTGYDGNALIGRKMNGGGNGNNENLPVADPGILEFNGVVVSGYSGLVLSIDVAAYKQGSNAFNNGDYLRVSWKEANSQNWEPSLLLDFTGPALQNIGSAFMTEVVALSTSWSAIDFKVEMMVTANKEHVALDNFLIVGCSDLDADGICDDVDDCVGDLDACGICNGPGAIYECGCADIPTGDCDCDGNQDDVLGVCGGDCTADADSDGICDDVDDCIGTLDACGTCNGPGAIYECGCADIPSGDCDCDGNQDDVLGVCGGDCTADADSDGICDDVDDCVGTPDACGICNGPGTIYDCGCFDTPEGDCDCDGNQLDALGVCGGDCTADVNLNGICDNEEAGCDDPDACNYDLDAPPYNPPSGQEGYCLELRTIVEHTSGDLMGMTTYRVHLHTENSTDFISAVSGDSANTMSLLTTSDFYQNPFGGALSASINPLLYPSFPSLQYDSWLTIGAVDNSSSVDFIGADFIGFEAGDNLVIDSPVGEHLVPAKRGRGWAST